MFGFKDRIILKQTRKIAAGTYALAKMDNKQFIAIYKRMEKRNAKSPCEYHLPDWFTIKIIPFEKDKAEFHGSFISGEEYPIVYKSLFLKELKKYHVYFEEIDENTYKIIRNDIT